MSTLKPSTSACTLASSSTAVNTEDESSAVDSEKTWCSCDQVESGHMLCCDNENCAIQWFHYVCTGIERAPKGKWFYLDCRKSLNFSKRGRQQKKTDMSDYV